MCVHEVDLCSVSFSAVFSLTDLTSCYIALGILVFSHAGAKTAATSSVCHQFSQLLEILGLSELTVIAHLPQTRSLPHTSIEKEQQQGEKQVYDNILPSTNPLALGSAGLGPNHSILT